MFIVVDWVKQIVHLHHLFLFRTGLVCLDSFIQGFQNSGCDWLKLEGGGWNLSMVGLQDVMKNGNKWNNKLKIKKNLQDLKETRLLYVQT